MQNIDQRKLDTREIEMVFESFFDNYKNLLANMIISEVIEKVNEKSIEELLDYLKISGQVFEFNDASEIDKLKIINQWFKGNLWTLEDAVYDMAIDSIEIAFPNERFYFE